jgi:hypothetical protein
LIYVLQLKIRTSAPLLQSDLLAAYAFAISMQI